MKRLLISLIAGAVGIALLLAGLSIDAWLHAEDPSLAQREGIFTLSNPGHALLGLGVLLTCGGILSALHIAWGMARPEGMLGKPYVRALSMRASALASIGAVVFALSVSASGHEHGDAEESVAHVHDGGMTHTDGESIDAASAQQLSAGASAGPATPVHTHADAASASDADAAHMDGTHAHDESMPGASPAREAANGSHRHSALNATAEEIACGNDLVHRTQEATARFADFNVAAAEGYRSNPAKPEATHYGNRTYRLDGKSMDLANPETLIYYTNRETAEKVLIGVMFTMPRGQSGPQPCGAVTSWHTHATCTNREMRDVVPVDHGATCAEGYLYGETVEMMHVWFVPGRKNGVAPVT